MSSVTVKLNESVWQTFSNLDTRADAIAEWIQATDDLKILRQTAIPVSALSEPQVQEKVRGTDLIWAFDATNKDQCSLIAGKEILYYCSVRCQGQSLSNLALVYDSRRDSLDELANRVEALKQEHRREHQILKRLSDKFPVISLRAADLADPKVREKVADADVFSVFDPQSPRTCHVLGTKKAMQLRKTGNPSAVGQLKLMVFALDLGLDSLDQFVAALDQIKGRNWQR